MLQERDSCLDRSCYTLQDQQKDTHTEGGTQWLAEVYAAAATAL